MTDDASPFFIAPHRFDALADDDMPRLDRRYELIPANGEQVLWRGALELRGQLFNDPAGRRGWTLADTMVTLTNRRLVHVHTGSVLAVVGEPARHRRSLRTRASRLVSGQLRWQWPSRLELRGDSRAAELFVVCDTLRTLQHPALALRGPAPRLTELARLIRQAVARFRLDHPALVSLSPWERKTLVDRAGPAPVVAGERITLPGALPVEFLSGADYHHQRRERPPTATRRTGRADRTVRSGADGQPGSAS